MKWLLLCCSAAIPHVLQAQIFTEINSGLTNQYRGSSWWGDYDGDGDLDVLITGIAFPEEAPRTQLFRHDGDGTFTDSGIQFRGFQGNHSAAWGDWDADGDLDIAFAGNGDAAIYRNDGESFTELALSLPGVHEASVTWGDYDNDGDLDLLVSGFNSGLGATTRIFRNDGGGVFQDSGIPLPGMRFGCGTWGDYDNDGDLDLALVGGGIGKVFRNDTIYSFTDIAAPLPSLGWGAAAWGDYDNDGDLDLALNGHDGPIVGGTRISRIYRNDGGTFTNINAPLAGLAFGAVAWADYDSDGKLDIIMTGSTNRYTPPRLYRNIGSGFEEAATTLPVVTDGRVSWGDYDRDGDLDLLVGGSILYRNNNNVTNAVPSSPTGLVASVNSNAVRLSWTPSTDSDQSGGLTYQVSLRSTTGESVIARMTDIATGLRRLPQFGNPGTSWTVTNLPPGTYYYSVQAIDNALAGSQFAPEQLFAIGRPWITSIRKRESDGYVEVHLGGQAGATYVVHRSVDLISWAQMATATISSGLAKVIDPQPPASRGFYRAWQAADSPP